MTVRIVRGTWHGLWYRSDVRLMMFYIEVNGKEELLVALMPVACKATCQDDFDLSDGKAMCKLDCLSCQHAKILTPMTFEELEKVHRITFSTEAPAIGPLSIDEIWGHVKGPIPLRVLTRAGRL